MKSAYDYIIPGMGKIIAKTDISIQVPHGTYGRVAPRSGLAAKNHIDIGAGVVDQDYTGNIGVVMFNHAQEDFEVKKGDRIAQFICEKIEYPELEEVASLNSTERGEGGFGSTGNLVMCRVAKSRVRVESGFEISFGLGLSQNITKYSQF